MRTQVDYRDGRDPVSGDPICLVPMTDRTDHFTDCNPDDRFADQAERVIAEEERQDRLRALKLKAAVGTLKDIIADAEMGFHPDRAVQAASSDLIIAMLAERLRAACKLLPPGNEAEVLRIETALAAAGAA